MHQTDKKKLNKKNAAEKQSTKKYLKITEKRHFGNEMQN